jgi:hypothetical protein
MLPDGERNSPPVAVRAGTRVVLPAGAGAAVVGGAVVAVGAEVVAGPVVGRAVVAGLLGGAAGNLELQAARDNATASTSPAGAGPPMVFMVVR